MAIQGPADLFVQELSGVYDSQKKTTEWKGEVVNQVRDANVQQLIRTEQQQGQQLVRNLESCFQALGTQPQDVRCLATDGMRTEYQKFMGQNPPPETVDMATLNLMVKAGNYERGCYTNLVDMAMAMGETRCAQILQTNLVMMDESKGRVERTGHEMRQRMMATA
ncbi:DUF892 family protein [Planosporangium flavigriseum]|uniref:Ferritin-like metal-binding protein YciE n=1 Tax=Planosporangium flavigriseum TaxID=373681 RepID=A0A8J3LZ41_9ACTN|nr:DUF892 family protein [Planosporangium flavigriseum]NJC67754.1 DUF892 family protein [Planosporangium flavigriseum]GIG76030.1 hypothetical protein Pfl04_44340 [Planosporangium flavigriseum]